MVKEFRKFENIDHSLRTSKLDLAILQACLENLEMLEVLSLLASTVHRATSRAYRTFHIELLKINNFIQTIRNEKI